MRPEPNPIEGSAQADNPSKIARALADAARLATLTGTGLVRSPAEPSFDRLSRFASRFLSVPMAFFSLVDAERQFFKSCVGLPDPWAIDREMPLSHSFCQHVVASGEPLVIDDARLDPRVSDNPAIADIGVLAYLGIPIVVHDRVIGSFAALDDSPRTWTVDDLATMNDLAQSVTSEILLRSEHRSALATQARLQTTLACIGDGVITTDPSGAISFLNPVAEALTGWTTAEAVGCSMAEVFRIVDEATREPVRNPVEKAVEHGGVVGLANHTTLIARDGTERPIDDSAAPIQSPDGTFLGCILIFRDISERREAEIRLDEAKILLDSMLAAGEVGTWTWDLQQGDLIVDEKFAAIFNIPPGQPNRGPVPYFLKFIHPDDQKMVMERMNRAIETRGWYEAEFRPVRPGGEIRWAVARGRVRSDHHGQATNLPGLVIDITDQKRLQNRLSDATIRLGHLLTSGSVATWTWDIGSNRVVADQNLAKLFSVSPEEAQGGLLESYTRSIHPDDRDRVAQAIEAAVAEGTEYDEEYRIARPDGDVRWVVARGSVERDPTGQATSLNGVIIDITDRHRAEQTIREKEAFQRLIFESVKDFSIFTTNLAGIITSWNVGAETVFGYSEAEAVGQSLGLVFTPEDRADGIPEQELTTAAETGRAGDERWHQRKNGSRFFASGTVRTITDAAGTLIGFAKVARDNTESRLAQRQVQESEERFRALFESMDEGFCIIQLRYDTWHRPQDYRFLLSNPAFEAIVRIKDPAGKWASEVLPGLDRTWHTIYARVARTGTPERFEMGEASLGGRSFTVNAFRIGDPGEQKVAVLFSDITDRVRNQADRERLVAQLTDADRRKDEFLAMLAHELRNPLGVISNSVELVQRVGKPEMLIELRGMIQYQIRHLTHLIDDLLDVSRITQGKIELRKQTVELTAIVRNAAELARPQVDEKRHELSVSTPVHPVLFVADPTRVEQMISNLLTNAAKYSEPGRTIDLTAEVDGDEVVFGVRDQGYGISAEMLPKVFGLFTQVDATIDRSRGGLGIGLTLVKNLAELHGGSVTAASEGKDLGSEFTLRLPIGVPAPAPAPTAPPPPATRDRPDRVKARILVIDDNRDTARMTSRLLAHQGYELTMAHDGHEGVEAATASHPDVILLDIGLPGMNGYEVAAALRNHECCRDSIIVAVSGYGETAARERSRAVGIDHHLTKPLDFDQLNTILRGLD